MINNNFEDDIDLTEFYETFISSARLVIVTIIITTALFSYYTFQKEPIKDQYIGMGFLDVGTYSVPDLSALGIKKEDEVLIQTVPQIVLDLNVKFRERQILLDHVDRAKSNLLITKIYGDEKTNMVIIESKSEDKELAVDAINKVIDFIIPYHNKTFKNIEKELNKNVDLKLKNIQYQLSQLDISIKENTNSKELLMAQIQNYQRILSIGLEQITGKEKNLLVSINDDIFKIQFQIHEIEIKLNMLKYKNISLLEKKSKLLFESKNAPQIGSILSLSYLPTRTIKEISTEVLSFQKIKTPISVFTGFLIGCLLAFLIILVKVFRRLILKK
jgi:hypothetical protein